MVTELKELIRLCRDELHDREYNAHHASILTTEWDSIALWFEQNGIMSFDRDSAFAYCDEAIGSHIIVDGMSASQRKQLRALRMLLSYQETGDFEFRSPSVEYDFPGATGCIITQYLQYERDRGRSEKTIEYKRHALCGFNKYLLGKGYNFFDLGVNEIEDYLSLSANGSLPLRHNNANHLRQLFHYLYDLGITDKDLAVLVLKDQYRKQCKLPTTYSEDEISHIISSVDRSSAIGKRDYLVLLLVSEYGWRAGDVVKFKLDQIDWDKNKISFEQGKTDIPVEFPLLASIGNAIIEYLKYSRPESDVPEVIVAHGGGKKGRPLSPETMHSIVSRYMCEANIAHWKEKKHGPHSLRHSLATNMLKNGVSMPVISTVLGHQRTETTNIYLKVDADRLALCAVPVPPVTSPFYKGVTDR